jgi:hypothetical protein
MTRRTRRLGVAVTSLVALLALPGTHASFGASLPACWIFMRAVWVERNALPVLPDDGHPQDWPRVVPERWPCPPASAPLGTS